VESSKVGTRWWPVYEASSVLYGASAASGAGAEGGQGAGASAASVTSAAVLLPRSPDRKQRPALASDERELRNMMPFDIFVWHQSEK
jgi:hypothetical protein